MVLVPESQRGRLVRYLDHWQENRERLSLLPSRRGKHLQIEWTGFPLHIDDKLRPKKKAEADEVAGLVDVRVNDTAVEFLSPAYAFQAARPRPSALFEAPRIHDPG